MNDPASSLLPANARIDVLTFDDAQRALQVTLRGAEARSVPAGEVASLYGARIRHDSVTTISTGGGISFGKLAITAATGIPVGVTKGGPKEKTDAGQELHHALALRAADVGETWYLLAASFNFRKALGADATYSSETNLRLFVRRLASFAPAASQDEYIAAIVGGSPLPPPVDSLLEFLRGTRRERA